jgi:hypothetical protein
VVYALVLAVAAGLLLLAIPAGLLLAGRRISWDGFSLRGWSWRPNALGFSLLTILAALALWRLFPEFLLLPVFLPLLWRWRDRRSGQAFAWQWRAKRGRPSTNGRSNGHQHGDDPSIEGQYRHKDDE